MATFDNKVPNSSQLLWLTKNKGLDFSLNFKKQPVFPNIPILNRGNPGIKPPNRWDKYSALNYNLNIIVHYSRKLTSILILD